LVAIPLEIDESGDRLTRPLAIVHRRQASLEPAAARFLELLIAEDVNGRRGAPLELQRIPASASP
jgi:hypothetical protein